MPTLLTMPNKRALTLENVESLLEAFRKAPGNYSHAARCAGVDSRTAKRGWLIGWRKWLEGKAIKDIIEDEQIEARAELERRKAEVSALEAELEARRRQEVQEQAQKDAMESTVQEGQMIRLARASSITLLGTLTQVSAGAAKIGGKVRAALEKQLNKDELTPLETVAATRLLAQLTTSLRQANDAALRAMEMERLFLGEPGKIVGVVQADFTMKEAEARINSAARALARAQQAGLTVLSGGHDITLAKDITPVKAPDPTGTDDES